ncbi:Similar to hypothetical protein GLRG_11182 [Glomerella graminicola M1.001]; acc. no. EFQ36038 [Pyronema omphalodes CBS 100304]|uniref:Uncharacterized protein n=1 Tax=Pyronema omphalodes (strain CBS 100304) TaxID=1076935 RepID=U4KXM9_PYROM|nr:Similar to hypothetical protein GLRG_11182 [Glomerella graminicola M1.001]; acc. no. EFQ36038 [Pyronema omphalodes CBS 100304]
MWILYFTIYVWLQAAPLYVLSEVQSICKNIQRIVHIGNANHLTNFRLNTVLDYFNGILPQIWIDKNLNLQPAVWDNDDWTFGQVLALSLWIPTVLDFFYALLIGEEDAFTGMLLKPWTASKRTEADVEPEGSDEVHHDPQVAEA